MVQKVKSPLRGLFKVKTNNYKILCFLLSAEKLLFKITIKQPEKKGVNKGKKLLDNPCLPV